MNTIEITTNGNRRNDPARIAAIEALRRIENDPTEDIVFFDEMDADGGEEMVPGTGWTVKDAREMAEEARRENASLRGYSRSERALILTARRHGEEVEIVRGSRRAH